MALIQNIETVVKERQQVHKATRCLASDFVDDAGNHYLQLDTYGSDEREFPEKVSQSIQLNRTGAESLLKLIRETFPGLE